MEAAYCALEQIIQSAQLEDDEKIPTMTLALIKNYYQIFEQFQVNIGGS